MRWLHITQDEHGFWMLSLEQSNGDVGLLAHQFTQPGHLIQHAMELVFGGPADPARFPDAQIIIDAPRGQVSENPEEWPAEYETPVGRKTLE
jgi:hypothetical protein